MLRYLILTLLVITAEAKGFSQTFDLLISNPIDEFAHASVELADGSFLVNYCRINPNFIGTPWDCKILNISNNGIVLKTISIIIDPNRPLVIEGFFNRNNDIYIYGSVGDSVTKVHKPIFAKLKTDFTIDYSEIYEHIISDGYFEKGIVNKQGNFVLLGRNYGAWDSFLCELNLEGDVIRSTGYLNHVFELTLVEVPDENGYFLYNQYSVRKYDYTFQEEPVTLPYKDYDFRIFSTKSLTDSTHIQSGVFLRKAVNPFTENRNNIGYKIVNSQFQVLDSLEFLSPDYNNEITYYQNPIDFVSKESIYLSFSKNINPQFGWGMVDMDTWYGLINMKEDGTINWQKFYGGDAFYINYAFLATNDGGGLMIGGRWDWRNNPVRDILIIKVDNEGNYVSTVGVKENNLQAKSILIYPNPAQNKLNINIGMYKSLHLKIFSIQGSLVAEQTLQSGINSIDVSGFSKGIYTYLIEGEKGFFEKGKFVKE
ncbi:MAG: T9SS type A sorting domain-containing protein [Bacteroidetes bacterium]|nr:T9SS type A sorting domain-containing protein [Bacteroidota bacterium]